MAVEKNVTAIRLIELFNKMNELDRRLLIGYMLAKEDNIQNLQQEKLEKESA